MRLGLNPPAQEKNWLVVIIIAGLINGLLHMFLMPPWQHYDEPGHFEYAWLIANRSGLPVPGEFDQQMRREVAASMIEYEFFAGMGFRPNLLSITEPVWIGISQTDDVPLYYMIEAIPLYIFRYSDITFQLYLGRLVSLSLFLVTIFGAYALTAELTEPGNPMRLLIPATVVFIPSFVNIMTAVNNDVAAAAFFTLFLWVSVRMMQRGISWLNLGSLILLAILCILTKSTTIFVIPLAIIALISTLLPKKGQTFLWMSIPVVGLIIFFVLAPFDGAAFWHSQSGVPSIQRVNVTEAPFGEHAMRLDSPRGGGASGVMQLLPKDNAQYLDNKVVTIGAWIWASEPAQARTPIIYNGGGNEYETIKVDTTPQFFAFSTRLIKLNNQLMFRLEIDRLPGEGEVSIFYDGIIVVEGDFTSEGQPNINDIDASFVEWGGRTSFNYIRNPSFELAAPRVRSNIETLVDAYLPARLSLVISSILDIEGYNDYFLSSAQHLFRSFWAVFGWGQVFLIGAKPYRILLIITLIALIGDIIYFWKVRHALRVNILGFLGIALIGVWGMAYTRGVDSVFSISFIPAARYATPVIVPTVMLFVIGWREILSLLGGWLHILKAYQYAAYIAFLVVLNLISIYSIVQFYGLR